MDERRADQKAAQQEAQQLHLFDAGKRESYRQIVAEKNRLVARYRNAAERLRTEDLTALRDEIQHHRAEAAELLDELLLDDFQTLGIRYEEATWDIANGKESKSKRRPLTIADIRTLQPFHWGYEFDEVMNGRGGFDAIITNPPWEIFKPNSKEFFADYSNVITRKMAFTEFEQAQDKLLQDPQIRAAWLEYLSRFPYQNIYFRTAPQYVNQSAITNGKKAGTDINFYKLFIEQCYNLLSHGGRCGIIVPSGIYTDLGSKTLRELLLTKNKMLELYGLSNEKFIFEGVHHGFRFCIFVFEKGGETTEFRAAFRINPREAVSPQQLDSFLNNDLDHITFSASLIRSLSPSSLSIMEFKDARDVAITEKVHKFPLLSDEIEGTWHLSLCREFHMTDDSDLYRKVRNQGDLPLYEGKLIHQFNHRWLPPNFWVNESEARDRLLKKRLKEIVQKTKVVRLGQHVSTDQLKLDYETYRIGFRDVAASTNERCMISTVLPPNVFCPHTMSLEAVYEDEVVNGELALNSTALRLSERLYLVSIFNSYIIDYLLRQRVANHVSFFFVYNLPVPRLTEGDSRFGPIVERAAKLICTTPEYDDLARGVGLGDHRAGVTDAAERAKLRAELDGLVAHLYGLTEDELRHILGTFPLVEQSMKEAVLTAYRAFAPNPDDAQVAALIAAGESDRVEFKVAVAWNAVQSKKDVTMRDNVVQGVAAFMNSREGGALIIGVDKHGNLVGIADDIANADSGKPNHDGYELYIRNGMAGAIGADLTLLYSITFHCVGRYEVCRIAAKPSPKPVYVNGDFYVRDGNSKKKLNAQQTQEYIKQRWP